MRSIKSYLVLAIDGLLMGAANVIPGVSGGTIAFLTGIYQELVDSLKSIDGTAVKLFFKGRFREFWQRINGGFLLAVFAGVVVSIFSLAKIMQYLLQNHPVAIWSFFFGLILVSTVFIMKEMGKFTLANSLSFIVGAGLGVFICIATPATTPDSLAFIFLCGAVTFCTMILPGISGSFILLLLGKYAYMLEAVSDLKLVILLVFAAGAVVGLLCFSHFLSWLLKKYYKPTLSLLCGLMFGSLLKVWPWKETLAAGTDRPLWPGQYAGDPQLASAIIWMIVGAALVAAINLAAAKSKKDKA
jgi:putative membrane protein